MEIVHKVHVDLALTRSVEQLSMVQYDSNSRIIENHLYSNSTKWKIPEGTVVKLFAQKPSGKFVYQNAEYVDNVVKASLHKQVLAENGLVYYQFELTNGDEVLSTFAGIIDVKNSLSNEGTEESATIVPEFERLTEEKIEEIRLAAQTEIEKILTRSELEQSHIAEKTSYFINEIESKKDEVLEAIREKGNKTLNSIPSDYIEINTRLEQSEKSIKEKAPAIVCDEKGSVISVSDASSEEIRGLNIYGKTIQNGTPTPEAPIELVSAGADGDIAVTVAGKNLFDPERLLQTAGNCVYDEATGLWTTGLGGGYNRSIFSDVAGVGTDRDIKYLLPLSENTTYTIKLFDYATATTVASLPRVNFHDKDGIHLGQKSFDDVATFTTPAGTRYVDFCRGHNAGNFSFSKIQLEVGSVATAYEAYKAQTITISTENGLPGIPVSSGGNYTDENGQRWVTDEIDLARGVHVKRIGTYTLTEEAEIKSYGSSKDGLFGTSVLSALAAYPSETLCSHYGQAVDNSYPANACGIDRYKSLWIMDARFNNSVSELKTWLSSNPVSVMYQLATPIETPLSAEEIADYSALYTNKPNTTVFNDSGAGQKVEYVADTKAYIDQKIAAISAAVLNA